MLRKIAHLIAAIMLLVLLGVAATIVSADGDEGKSVGPAASLNSCGL